MPDDVFPIDSPALKISFLETDPASEAVFREALPGHPLEFTGQLSDLDPDAGILSVFIRTEITDELLSELSSLKLIATRSTGTEHIDLAACEARGIQVARVPSYGENTVAEHTFALILALSRRIRESVEASEKPQFSPEAIRGFDLKGKTLGIIGTGRIGIHAIRIARGFGMKVLACDPEPKPAMADELDFHYTTLDRVLAESHILSLHASLTDSTRHLLNRVTLACTRRGVVIVNTSRGGLIDTDALLEALQSGQVAGAGLDVLEDENIHFEGATRIIGEQIIRHMHESSPEELAFREQSRLAELRGILRNKLLISRPDVLFTPHVAYNSVEAVARINEITVKNILAFAAGNPINLVPA